MSRQGLDGVRVFIAEDEPLVSMLVESMLEELGCVVAGIADNFADALRDANAGGFDVALLDINLSGTEVFPVASALRKQGIPYVFSSGYGSAGLPPEFQASPVVPKPYQIEDLARGLSLAVR